MISYADAANYWESIDATNDGMLGGYAKLDQLDASSSSRFIHNFLKNGSLKRIRACDCGAGIGRVSKSFLLNHFEKVDLVEQTGKFLEQAKQDFVNVGLGDRLENCYPVGLQDFTPEFKRYDLIWCQWVLTHLTDDDLVEFLKRCKAASPQYIGVKENVSIGTVVFDEEDSSMTRPDHLWKEIFERAGLKLVSESRQNAFPSHLFEVKMYLLK